jgi:hypothetical protein
MRTLPKFAPNRGSMKVRTDTGSGRPPVVMIAPGLDAGAELASARRTIVAPGLASRSRFTAAASLPEALISTTLRAVCLASCSAGSFGLEIRAHCTESGDDTDTRAGLVAGRAEVCSGATTFAGRGATRTAGTAASAVLWAILAIGAGGIAERGFISDRCKVALPFASPTVLTGCAFCRGGARAH